MNTSKINKLHNEVTHTSHGLTPFISRATHTELMIAFRVGRNFFMSHTTTLSGCAVASGSEGPGCPQPVLILGYNNSN
jgi:hypothetical protein